MTHFYWFLVIVVFAGSSCASRIAEIRFDPSRKREVLIPQRPSSRVDVPTREEVSEIIKGEPVSLPKIAETRSSFEEPPASSPSVIRPLERSWTMKLKETLNAEALSPDQKIDEATLQIETLFSNQRLGIEQMVNELKQSAPEALEVFDYWLLGKLWDQQKYDEASRFASQLMTSGYEKIRTKAQYLFDQYYLVRKASAQKIGVLVPPNSKQATRLLNALKLAFGQVEGNTSAYQLIVVEEPDDTEKYEQAFSDLVKKENVIAIIGGLKSKNRDEISKYSQMYRIPFLYMGQKSRVTDNSPYIFQYGFTNESQVRAAVLHAQAQGIKKFAIIYPNDGFGIEAANLFWDDWSATGGQITAAYTYHPQENDFQEIAAKLSNKFNLNDRLEEFKTLQKEKIEKDPQNKRKILAQGPAELLPAEFNFDAVFIPDVSRSMAKITASMAYYGIRRLPVYGTRLWANPETFKLAGSMWASYLLVPESIYNQPEMFQLKHPFYLDYQKLYGYQAEHLEVAAFELSLLLKGVLGVQGVSSREGLREALVQTASVVGLLNQPIYFDEFREIEGPVVVMRFNHLGQLIPESSQIQ